MADGIPASGLECPACHQLNPPDARFCSRCGQPTASSASTQAERRQLTVLFCDLVGSTELAARLDPEDWREVLRQYHERADDVVGRFGGHVAQHLGDGVLAYFGWPQTYDDAAERAVRAGLALVEPAGAVAADGHPLSVRIGLHTGPVVVGALGTRGRQETLALGEVPNVAARVQAAAEPGTVLVTAATQRLAAGIFVVEERGAHLLKGVPEPVVLYRVVQPSGVRSRLDGAAGRLTPFVGRQTELGTLVDTWERVLDGIGQTVLVSGEAGVGKSRLVYQLRERLAGEPHTWLECRCSPYANVSALQPVIELVEQGLAFTSADDAAAKLDKLEAGLLRAGLDVADNAPLMAALLGISAADRYRAMRFSPELQREKTLAALVAWTLALGGIQPVLLLVEDLHWCDPSSLELFGRLLAQIPTARVLMLLTGRPEFVPPWTLGASWTPLVVARLPTRQARELVAAMPVNAPLPEQVLSTIVDRADGVPLYLEELTRGVLETSAAGGTDAVPAARVSERTIPVTLKDSLMARLDRLGGAKEVAQTAAVLGREFSYELLAVVMEQTAGTLPASLRRLLDAELLYQRGTPPHASYIFKHGLIQESAYQSLLRKTRQELHAKVAQALKERFPDRAETNPEIVARHFDEAGLAREAIAYYQRAGQRATQRSAHAEAIEHFKRGIALVAMLPETPERNHQELMLRVDLGAPITAIRGYADPELEETYARARDLVAATSEDAELVRALRGLSASHYIRGDHPTALELGHRALALAERTGQAFSRIISHVMIGHASWGLGRFSDGLEHYDHVRALYDPAMHGSLGHITGYDEGSVAGAGAAVCLWALGYPDRAVERGRSAADLARQVDHPLALANALSLLALVHRWRREREPTREVAEEGLALSRKLGFPLYVGLGSILRGWALAQSPAATVHAEEIERAMAELAGTGTEAGAAFYLGILADAQWTVGRQDTARATLEMALAVNSMKPQPFPDADLFRLKGEMLAEGGDGSAEESFLRALDVARSQQAKSFELRAATSLARLWQRQGRGADARALLAPVHAWFTEGFDTPDLRDAKALLDAPR